MAGNSGTQIEALDAICEVLNTQLAAIVGELETFNTSVNALKLDIASIKAQLTAVQNAYSESGPQTLGENIQDIRDDTREGTERGKEQLRKRGLL